MTTARFWLASFLALVAVLSMFSAITLNVAVASRTIFVPADFSTIQDAVNNAVGGDTVFVYNGTYVENVVVNKAISLVGENNVTTFINGGHVGAAVRVTVDGVSISGFTIGNGSLAEGGAGILLEKVRSANLSDNVIVSSYVGTSLINSSLSNFHNNYVSRCTIGLLMNFSENNIVEQNTFSASTEEAVYLNRCSNNTLEGNNISAGGAYGIRLGYSPQNRVQGNVVANCNTGLLLEHSGGTTLSENSVHSNLWNFGVSGDGLPDYVQSIDMSNKVDGKSIYYLVNAKDVLLDAPQSQDVGYLGIVNSSNIRAKNLNLSHNADGFLCVYSVDCLLESSDVTNNRAASLVYYSARCSLVSDDFASNTQGVSLVSSANSSVKNNSFTDTDEYGLTLESSGNSVVDRNLIQQNSLGGLSLYSSQNCNVSGNSILRNGFGIFVQFSAGVNVTNNVVANNSGNGVFFSYSDNGSAGNNRVSDNDGYGIFFQSAQFASVVNNSLKNNTQSGIYLYTCLRGRVSSNVAEHNQAGVTLQSCLNTKANGNQIVSNIHEGILLLDSANSDISVNTILSNGWEGLSFHNSGNSIVNANTVCNNTRYGIWLQDSPQTIILNSNVSSNADDGIYLRASHNSTILNNVMDGNSNAGCRLYYTDSVNLSQNDLSNNRYGVRVLNAENNTISDNKILKNLEYGVDLYNSTGSRLYGNSFINNTIQNAKILNASSVWDQGYPDGGNYWSDYVGSDSHWGPKQDQPGSDDIGDTPYVIDSENRDNYPLMTPSRLHDMAIEKIVLPANEVYVGWVFNVTVTVENVGGYVESANVTVYDGGSAIGFRQISNLTAGAGSAVNLVWNTSGLPQCHVYDVRAEVSIVIGETRVENNVYDYGPVKVKMVGDVNSDGKINILDIAAIATAFGTGLGASRYKVNYDMNLDYAINIVDLSMAARNYSKTCSYQG
jgi:parallel beta-helix repeat protein